MQTCRCSICGNNITPLCYLWSLPSTHSTQFPLYQIMGYLTLTVKCSSHQHTAGSTFLGTYAIMNKSGFVFHQLWTPDLHTACWWGNSVFPANYCTLLHSIYCSVPSASWQREIKSRVGEGLFCIGGATWRRCTFRENKSSVGGAKASERTQKHTFRWTRGATRQSLFKPDIYWSQDKH